jgi:hypothetical protein
MQKQDHPKKIFLDAQKYTYFGSRMCRVGNVYEFTRLVDLI